MNKTTKILLAFGLLMAVIIPVTVKGLFTETDFFDTSESSKMDYLQPYKPKPETAISLPKGMGKSSGDNLDASEQPAPRVRTQSSSSYKSSREIKKINVPIPDVSEDQLEASGNESGTEDLFYK